MPLALEDLPTPEIGSRDVLASATHHEPRGVRYMGVNWVGPAIMRHGTGEQKRRHLLAIPNGSGWLVRGQKIWTSYAAMAQWCFLLARTSNDVLGEPGQAGGSCRQEVLAFERIGTARYARCDRLHGRRHGDRRRGRRLALATPATSSGQDGVMLSHEMAIMTSKALRAAIAAVIVALTVTSCGISAPDPAACKAAIQAEYLKGKGHLGAEPAICKGLPKAQVQRFTQQVLEGK